MRSKAKAQEIGQKTLPRGARKFAVEHYVLALETAVRSYGVMVAKMTDGPYKEAMQSHQEALQELSDVLGVANQYRHSNELH